MPQWYRSMYRFVGSAHTYIGHGYGCQYSISTSNVVPDNALNLLPHIPILGSSNLAANKDIMSKILTNGDTTFLLSRKHCGKRRNCSLRAISSFPTMFSRAVCC